MKIEPKMFDNVKDKALLDVMFKSAISQARGILEIKMVEAAYSKALYKIRAKEAKNGTDV